MSCYLFFLKETYKDISLTLELGTMTDLEITFGRTRNVMDSNYACDYFLSKSDQQTNGLYKKNMLRQSMIQNNDC